MIETIHLAHMPPELALYAVLYKNVENASFLKEQLLAGNSDFEYAFIDASMVISRKQALSAAFRAMNDYIHDRLKSRNIHSEIVFAFSPNNNIGEAFRRFGIGDSTKDLLVFKVATSSDINAASVERHLSESVKGVAVSFDDGELSPLSDLVRMRKIYKIPSVEGKAGKKVVNGDIGSKVSVVDERVELETQILGLMALRGAT